MAIQDICAVSMHVYAIYGSIASTYRVYSHFSLRCLLTDDEREVRASALRVLRYLIQSEDDLKVALRLHLDVLIARYVILFIISHLKKVLHLLLGYAHNLYSST